MLWIVVLLCLGCRFPVAAAAPLGQWVLSKTNVSGGMVRNQAGSPDGQFMGPLTLTSDPEAVLFDGVQNFVQLSPALPPTVLPRTNLSVGAWVAMRSAGQWPGIVGCLQDNGDFERGWVLGAHDSKFYFALTSDGTLNYLYAPSAFQLNRWYHVLGTYDGVQQKLFINGRLVATAGTEKGAVLYSAAPYVLGAYKDDNEFYPLDGWLREVAVYGHTLSAPEVLATYQSQSNLFPATIQLPPPKPSPLLGPVVRFTDPSSAVVEWQTATPVRTSLEWGVAEALESVVADSVMKTVHEVTLRGLKPKTRYFFRVEANVLPPSTPVTSPIYDFETDFNYTLPPIDPRLAPFPADDRTEWYGKIAESILAETGITRGYALDYGAIDGRLAWELVRRSDLQVMVVSSNAAVVQELRLRLQASGLYGTRISAVHTSLAALPYTKNWFNMILSSSALHGGAPAGVAAELFRVLRPSGGIVLLGNPDGMADSFPRSAEWEAWLRGGVPADSMDVVVTPGRGLRGTRRALPGAGQWTHNFADPAQTVCSQDERVLGRDMKVQWFGEPGPRGFTDRQARNPSPLVANGTLYTQGNNRLAAQDAHNGRMYWSLEIPELRRVNMPRDGGNWCADSTSVMVAHRQSVLRLDARTGRTQRIYSVPEAAEGYDWGYVATVDDRLYGSSVKKGSFYTKYDGSWEFWYDSTTALNEISKICSHRLFCLAKADGTSLWSYTNGVVINNTIAIGGGRIYFVDCRNPAILNYASGRIDSANLWRSNSIVALDARTGELLWEKPLAVPVSPYPVVFYLSYAGERLVLNDSTTQYNVFCYSAADGSQIWKKSHAWNRNHHGGHMYHPVIVGKQVIVEPYVYDLESGAVIRSGLPERGGCTTMSAAAKAVHYINWDYAKGSPFIWDLDTQQRREMAGTRSSCFLSLISGEGMVLMPAASAGCACRFPIQSTISYAAP
ncbi:MAG: PQQ-binding-like beta-propeller repeat protein [Verrucomicrobiales bacterium]|nr:PQQ-binding-like beta-propeller repeat protein [Verrucomicrobiales bacterium]